MQQPRTLPLHTLVGKVGPFKHKFSGGGVQEIVQREQRIQLLDSDSSRQSGLGRWRGFAPLVFDHGLRMTTAVQLWGTQEDRSHKRTLL